MPCWRAKCIRPIESGPPIWPPPPWHCHREKMHAKQTHWDQIEILKSDLLCSSRPLNLHIYTYLEVKRRLSKAAHSRWSSSEDHITRLEGHKPTKKNMEATLLTTSYPVSRVLTVISMPQGLPSCALSGWCWSPGQSLRSNDTWYPVDEDLNNGTVNYWAIPTSKSKTTVDSRTVHTWWAWFALHWLQIINHIRETHFANHLHSLGKTIYL